MPDCEHCRLEKVVWQDVFSCTCLSIQNLCHDVAAGGNITESMFRDDRVLYVIGLILLVMTLRLLITQPPRGHP